MAASLKDYLVRIVAHVEGGDKATSFVDKTDKGLKQVAKSAAAVSKQFAKTLIGYQGLAKIALTAARNLRALIKSTIDLNDNLEQTAKKLNMTTEKARAHQIALQVMGKTMQEINNDASLKKTYDELVKLGEGMALPDAAKGMAAIKNLKGSINGLRVTLRYGLQWVYYYLQKYLETPFKRLKDWLDGKNGDFGAKVKEVANKIANALATAYKIVERLFKDIGHIFEGVKKAFNFLDGNGKKTLLMIVGILMLIFNKGMLLKALFIGLISLLDDFFTWMEGGESVIGTEVWNRIIDFIIGVRNTIASIVNSILDAINEISNSKIGKWLGLDGANIEWRMDMFDADAIKDFIAAAREENAKKSNENKTSDAAAVSAGSAGSGGSPQMSNNPLMTANATNNNTNTVNSNNVTTNNYNVNMTVNAQGASDTAQAYENAINSANRNLGAATA